MSRVCLRSIAKPMMVRTATASQSRIDIFCLSILRQQTTHAAKAAASSAGIVSPSITLPLTAYRLLSDRRRSHSLKNSPFSAEFVSISSRRAVVTKRILA